MNFDTLKQELYKKIKNMSKEDFTNFIDELKRIYDKAHPYQKVRASFKGVVTF